MRSLLASCGCFEGVARLVAAAPSTANSAACRSGCCVREKKAAASVPLASTTADEASPSAARTAGSVDVKSIDLTVGQPSAPTTAPQLASPSFMSPTISRLGSPRRNDEDAGHPRARELYDCVWDGDASGMQEALVAGASPLTAFTDRLNTALHAAARCNNLFMLEIICRWLHEEQCRREDCIVIVRPGAPATAKGKVATFNGEFPADVENRGGDLPLWCALDEGHEGAVKLLTESGLCDLTRCQGGVSIVAHSRKLGREQFVAYFESLGVE